MKKVIIVLLVLVIFGITVNGFCARVVKEKITGKIVYRSEPEFKKGLGIKNAVAMNGGKPEDYKEVEIIQQDWDLHLEVLSNTPEKLIQRKIKKILRRQAIKELKAEGKLK